jgi:MarR family transcriptional regulator for hemolysin
VPRPITPPIGLVLSRVAKEVSTTFDDALSAAGGTLPMWLVLLSIKSGTASTQRELAQAVGIKEATLTHHLTAMAKDGLVERERDPANQRVQLVRLTAAGEQRFDALRAAAVAFDKRLRTGFDETDLTALAQLLSRLSSNVSG